MSGLETGAARLAAAAIVIVVYATLCIGVWTLERRKRAHAATRAQALAGANAQAGAPDAPARSVLIVHASQTGAAEQLAWQTAQALHGAGLPLRVEPLGALTSADLAAATTVLFIASTCGEGDAPDSAARFVRRFMGESAEPPLSLAHLHVGVLALGDREFANFCAFGRRLADWLAQRGAASLFYRIDVDAMDGAALAHWQHEMGRLASVGDTLDWRAAVPQAWRLAERHHLNAGSAGAPVFHLQLAPPDGVAAPWEPGDLVQVHVPGTTARPREYSIASTPAEGRVHLLVRQERREEGLLGLASGWLTRDAAIGAEIALTVLPHRNFRLGANATRPLILVGNGTGIAGLRAHLRARADAGPTRNWLVFGERQRAHDFHFRDDVEAWQANGLIERVDLAFSRDQPEKDYVQHRLRAQAPRVREWLDAGAAIYLCGSLDGMAAGVEAALGEIAGSDGLEALIDSGRYRRDVY
jgi:sulfite reductase (NADPH) flavoprotein alpha-component